LSILRVDYFLPLTKAGALRRQGAQISGRFSLKTQSVHPGQVSGRKFVQGTDIVKFLLVISFGAIA
jgi:hypothetical protein